MILGERPFFAAIVAGALALAAAAPAARAAAGATGDDKKKEPEPVPDSEGHGAGMRPEQKNPLPEIIDLMRKVEERLAEAETNEWTRAEQEKIVRALEGQQSAVEKLKALIKLVEEQSQAGGGGGGGQQRKSSGGDPQKKPQPRQQDEQQQPLDPQQQKGDKTPRDGKRSDDPQRKRQENERRDDGKIDPKSTSNAANKWGDLPEKKAREVIDAKQKEMPPQYRRQLEEYYRRLSDPKK